MLPTILAKQLKQGIIDYVKTTFPMANAPFDKSLEDFFKKDALVKDPYVALKLPFAKNEKFDNEKIKYFDAINLKYQPYAHQEKAWKRLIKDNIKSTLVATGTGSGKTECFLYPILEYCYQHRNESGIKALIIYPMNALASDQAERIAKLIYSNPLLKSNVTAGEYIGGETSETSIKVMQPDKIITDHEVLLQSPPDILLTNYKMLDYLLVRLRDSKIWKKNNKESLKFLIVDELHTFDGAQGTDLACLIRRVKNRLKSPQNYVCCVGTSATLGGEENNENILNYAKKIFDEEFDKESIVTEERVTIDKFFEDIEILEDKFPTTQDIQNLNKFLAMDNEDEYLKSSINAWFDDKKEILDKTDDIARVALGEKLMHHKCFKLILSITKGNFWQIKEISKSLSLELPEMNLLNDEEKETVLNSLFSLVSFARKKEGECIVPFLQVQVQLWLQELRRFLASVGNEKISYALYSDLNREEQGKYLPVVNCRDCGMTGWVSKRSLDNSSLHINVLREFYSDFFSSEDKIMMVFPNAFPDGTEKLPKGFYPIYICPNCLSYRENPEKSTCDICGHKLIKCHYNNNLEFNNHSYTCPFCNSKRGLSLMGLRSTTAISAELSQIFASNFNDDKKTLAFSDSVQDAAHKAGFFNSRTWTFSMRTVLQKYARNVEKEKISFKYFKQGFPDFWQSRLSEKDFVGFFTPPELAWRSEYEDLIENREIKPLQFKKILPDIKHRMEYTVLIEYGISSNIGRTLLKSGCSGIAFSNEDIKNVASEVMEKVKNESLCKFDIKDYEKTIMGILELLRETGAIYDDVYKQYVKSGKNAFHLSNDRLSWLPKGMANRLAPNFIKESYDKSVDEKFVKFMSKSLNFPNDDYLKIILEHIKKELKNIGLLKPFQDDFLTSEFLGINPDKIFISNKISKFYCDKCHKIYSVAGDNDKLWEGMACLRDGCGGHIKKSDMPVVDYYGNLFLSSNLSRINAKEHTGLLERQDREKLEKIFKSNNERLYSDPNILSCTPTLEMGIDIGDLSTVVMCSMPSTQAQYTQRAGRAGRRDGNSLIMTVANAKPHDLYFYEEPLEMINGSVTPPDIFLEASSVLERQLIAFCFDNWMQTPLRDDDFPKELKSTIGNVEKWNSEKFPCNFCEFVQENKDKFFNDFILMFKKNWKNDYVKEQLYEFLNDNDKPSNFFEKIKKAYVDVNKQIQSLNANIKELEKRKKELEEKVEDSSNDKELKELRSEIYSFKNVKKNLQDKKTIEFLTDEGILPNYAFPEDGIILKAVLYRDNVDENEDTNSRFYKKKRAKTYYEFGRSASSAISEFAPENVFYAGGHSLKVNRVDLNLSKFETWRLCPDCSYACLEMEGEHTASCPRCGSMGWGDTKQRQKMIKPQVVYSYMDYNKSLIDDSSDDRESTYYLKNLLVDVDEDKDVKSAFKLTYFSDDEQENEFGYDFVDKATIREINFGKYAGDDVLKEMAVNGEKKTRLGFKLCPKCGKVQEGNKPSHDITCQYRGKEVSYDEEECLFMYREVVTEAIRILIPATNYESTGVQAESFVSAFMLGMTKYFGNVSHLRASIYNMPEKNDPTIRRQYLIIYDSVPGGTGYLKQLMEKQDALLDVLEKSLTVLKNCNCQNTEKDGCYHCLYAHRISQDIGSISRKSAINTLSAILSGRGSLKKIKGLKDISVSAQFQSELEEKFIASLKSWPNVKISSQIKFGKKIFILSFDDENKKDFISWEIEPQVDLNLADGVRKKCRPDFVFYPLNKNSKRKPIAIFTDGFAYHKDRIDDDTMKRSAIIASGNFYVWTFSWEDVDEAKSKCFDDKMYLSKIYSLGGIPSNDEINLKDENIFQIFIKFLKDSDAEEKFKDLSAKLIRPFIKKFLYQSEEQFNAYKNEIFKVIDKLEFEDNEFEFSKASISFCEVDKYFKIIASCKMKNQKVVYRFFTILDDSNDNALKERVELYKKPWNAFWNWNNLMQFLDGFLGVTEKGLEYTGQYQVSKISDNAKDSENQKDSIDEILDDGWEKTMQYIVPDAKNFAKLAKENGWPAPDECGYEVIGDDDAVMATIEMAWIDKKIGFQLPEQIDDKNKLENLGWKIFVAESKIAPFKN